MLYMHDELMHEQLKGTIKADLGFLCWLCGMFYQPALVIYHLRKHPLEST